MTRLEYLYENTDGIILRKIETREFLEVTMDRYGDIVTYRVYGDENKGFSLTER